MSITLEKKSEIVNQFKINAKDCGSSAVQIAILSERIKNLTEHFKTHKKDHHSRRGLFVLVGQRKRLLKYLKNTNTKLFSEVTSKIGLKA